MPRKKLYAYAMIVALVSFLGFWVENIWMLLSYGCMNNRNMYLPFLLGYGIAIMLIYAMFGTPQKLRFFTKPLPIVSGPARIAVYYGFSCLCVMVGEIALGSFVELTAGIIWWDYTWLPLHITRYTSIPTTLAFGALITLFMGCFFEWLNTLFQRVDEKKLRFAARAAMLVLTFDFLHSATCMYRDGALLQLWQIQLPLWK